MCVVTSENRSPLDLSDINAAMSGTYKCGNNINNTRRIMIVREPAHVMSDEESSSSDDDNNDDDDDETRSSYYPFYNWRAERLLREEFIAVCKIIIIIIKINFWACV